MGDRSSRHKAIAEEYEKCGNKKGDDYGKGKFYEVYKAYMRIGVKRKKPLSDPHKAIKIKNGTYRGNKRHKIA